MFASCCFSLNDPKTVSRWLLFLSLFPASFSFLFFLFLNFPHSLILLFVWLLLLLLKWAKSEANESVAPAALIGTQTASVCLSARVWVCRNLLLIPRVKLLVLEAAEGRKLSKWWKLLMESAEGEGGLHCCTVLLNLSLSLAVVSSRTTLKSPPELEEVI